jgi:hypothetical protein
MGAIGRSAPRQLTAHLRLIVVRVPPRQPRRCQQRASTQGREREPRAAVDRSPRPSATPWSQEDSVEQIIRMFRRRNGTTRNRCLRPSAATGCSRSATAVSRSCPLVSATARRSDHRRAGATTACGRSARGGPSTRRGATAALQGRSFPHRAGRQWDRCQMCRRRTDACLRRYHDAVPGQARDRPTEDDGIGTAALTCERATAPPSFRANCPHRCSSWASYLRRRMAPSPEPRRPRAPGDERAKARRGARGCRWQPHALLMLQETGRRLFAMRSLRVWPAYQRPVLRFHRRQ